MDRVITANESGGPVVALRNREKRVAASSFIKEQRCKNSPAQVTQDALARTRIDTCTHHKFYHHRKML